MVRTCDSLFVRMEEQLHPWQQMQQTWHKVRLTDLPGVPALTCQQIFPKVLLAHSSAWVFLPPGCRSEVISLKLTCTLQAAVTGQSSTCTHKAAQRGLANWTVPTGENQEGFTDGSTELHPPSYKVETNAKIKLVVFDLLNTIHFNSLCQQKVIFSLAIFILSEMGRTH